MKETLPKNDSLARPRTIGRLAEQAGVSVETIRFYQRRGLLRKPEMPVSGWRQYDESAVWVIHYLKMGRELGFTLAELKSLIGNAPGGENFCASVQKAYEDKIVLLDQQIENIKAMRRNLKKALTACTKRSATGNCPIAERCRTQFTEPVMHITNRRKP